MEPPVHVCYCQIPKEELERIARLKYVDRMETRQLMDIAKNNKEREYVAAISLLDVDISEIPKLVPRDEPTLLQHLLDCRDHILYVLKSAGINVSKR